jgi:hypothetical protein
MLGMPTQKSDWLTGTNNLNHNATARFSENRLKLNAVEGQTAPYCEVKKPHRGLVGQDSTPRD